MVLPMQKCSDLKKKISIEKCWTHYLFSKRDDQLLLINIQVVGCVTLTTSEARIIGVIRLPNNI